MKITFLGANHEVTGSCTLIEAAGRHFLIDCGMEQGKDVYENQPIPVAPGEIDWVLATHAHIDHTGMLPLLVRNGFRGKIYATNPTVELCGIMLRDSAHIQEFEAEWKNRKGQRSGAEPVEPMYTVQDAEAAMKLFRGVNYEQRVELAPGIEARFVDVGHLLGSASIELWITGAKIPQNWCSPAISAIWTSPSSGTPPTSKRRTMSLWSLPTATAATGQSRIM